MKLRINNTLIVPMTQEGLYFKGDIGIDGKYISWIGKQPQGFEADRIIDGTGYLAMPSLINSHTHLSMGLMRNYKDDLPTLQAWLGEIFPIEDKLTEDDILKASRLGALELIQGGTTLFTDMYFQPQATAQASLEAGLRASIGVTLFGELSDNVERMKEREKLLAPYLQEADGRIVLNCAPHAIYTCTKETYQYAASWTREHQTILHTHLSETEKEVQDCLSVHKLTPPQYLSEIGVLQDLKGMLAHCVHLTESDIALISSLDMTIVHNPSSNLKLGSGIAPIASYIKGGIPIALGTDGASSNNNLNMFEEMHIASLLGRVSGQTTKLKPYQVLEMATKNGAMAMGLQEKIGTLEVGKEADLILIDLQKSHLTPLNDPFSALVYATQASDVATVICQGNILMENHAMKTLNENQILRDVNDTWANVLQR